MSLHVFATNMNNKQRTNTQQDKHNKGCTAEPSITEPNQGVTVTHHEQPPSDQTACVFGLTVVTAKTLRLHCKKSHLVNSLSIMHTIERLPSTKSSSEHGLIPIDLIDPTQITKIKTNM